jgi:hypothetical protein
MPYFEIIVVAAQRGMPNAHIPKGGGGMHLQCIRQTRLQ